MPAQLTKSVHGRLPVVEQWGRNVRTRREQLGMGQKQLAQASDVPQQTISKVELGKITPTIEMLFKVALGLGAEPADLFGWPKLREVAH